MSMLDNLLNDGAEAAFRAALGDFLDEAVKEGKLPALNAAYIEQGAVDALDFGLKQWEVSQPTKPPQT